MKLTPVLLGAGGLALMMGGVAGASIDTVPLQRGNDLLEEIALAASTHPGDRPRSLERAPANQYAMETPEGRVEVDELGWYGRYRKELGGGELDFDADRQEAGYEPYEMGEFDSRLEEPQAHEIVPMRSPVNPTEFAAYEESGAVRPLDLQRPAQVARNDGIVLPQEADRGVGNSRMVNVQAELAARY